MPYKKQDRRPVMIAESWNWGTGSFTGLDEGRACSGEGESELVGERAANLAEQRLPFRRRSA
jgi:hypothetical protein